MPPAPKSYLMWYHLDMQEQWKGTNGYDFVSERFGSIFLEQKRDVAFQVRERAYVMAWS